MSEPAANLIPTDFAAPLPERSRSTPRIIFLAVIFFIAQFAAVYFLGTKKQIVPRVVGKAPHFTLAENRDELIALDDPTLFALPHANDFSTKMWAKIPTANPPDFHWLEPARWLELDTKNLGAALKNYLQTNAAAETPLSFKTEPPLDAPVVAAAEIFLEKNSSLQISGALAQRKLLAPITLPTLAVNDVIGTSRVQLLVAPDGAVLSAVLLESCGYANVIKPDQLALQIAGSAKFNPAAELMFGEILFKWHTEPSASTNSPEPK